MSDISPRSRARRAFRSPKSRGAVALMAAVFSVMGVLLMAATLEWGFLLNKRRQSDQAIDAMATAWAIQARDYPYRYWQTPTFTAQAIKQANMMSDDSINSTVYQAPQFDPGSWANSSLLFADSWRPIFVNVTGSYQVHDTTPIGRLVTGTGTLGIGASLPQLTSAAKMRVSQVQLGTFNMQPERVVLLLDFSKTMLLNYTGSGATGTLKAYQVVAETAKTIIDSYGPLVNLGVRCFSDNSGNPPDTVVDPQSQNDIKSSNVANHELDILNKVSQANPRGDGTDLQAAVQAAAGSLLNAGSSLQNTAYQSAARIILITDGEPDKQGGTMAGSSGDRDSQIASFRQSTLEAMDIAWNNNNITPGGITSNVIFIQRQGENGDKIAGLSTSDFLSSLAGSRTDHDGTGFMQDGGDPAKVTSFIQNNLKIMNYCYMGPISSVKGLDRYGAFSQYVLPQKDRSGRCEPVSAFYVPDIKRPDIEYPMTLIVDDMAQYMQLQSTAGAYLDPSTGTIPAGYFDIASNQKQLIAHYDSSSQILRLGGMLCAAFSTGSNPSDLHMRIRLRWGYPRPISNTCVAASETPSCSY